jgi:hypothetical protein
MTIYVHARYLAEFFLELEMFQTKVVKKIKTHILCSITTPPLPPENHAFCEIMWKNTAEPGMPQITIWP